MLPKREKGSTHGVAEVKDWFNLIERLLNLRIIVKSIVMISATHHDLECLSCSWRSLPGLKTARTAARQSLFPSLINQHMHDASSYTTTTLEQYIIFSPNFFNALALPVVAYLHDCLRPLAGSNYLHIVQGLRSTFVPFISKLESNLTSSLLRLYVSISIY